MSNDRIVRERMGLRVIRILTNILLLAGPAAALGILIGASRAGVAAVCLWMVMLALAADQMQHRVRSFRLYTSCCLLMITLTALIGWLAFPAAPQGAPQEPQSKPQPTANSEALPTANSEAQPTANSEAPQEPQPAAHSAGWIVLTVLSLAEVLGLYEGRITQKPAFSPYPGHLVLPILIWMLGTFDGIGPLRTLAFAMETGLVLLFLAWHNQKSLEKTYTAASERTRVPYAKIRRLNTALLVFYLLAALLLCLALTAVCSEDEAVFWLPSVFLMVFGLIWGAVIALFSLLVGWMTGGNAGAAAPVHPIDLAAIESLFPWLHTLWIIMDWTLFVIGVLVFVYLIYVNLYNFYYNFLAADPETGDTRKRQNTKETRKKYRPGRRRLPILAGLGPAAGIRREYIALIRMFPGGTELPGSYTPSQIEYAVAGEAASEEEWREIHRLYEKAKYAPQLTDRSDLRRMRELVRRRSEAERRRQEMVKRKIL